MKPQTNDLKENLVIYEQLDPTDPNAQEALASACIADPDWQIRAIAVEKLTEPSLLAQVAKHSTDYETFKQAIAKLEDETLLGSVAEYPCSDRYACIVALRKVKDQDTLFRIAQRHAYTEVRAAAVPYVTDPDHLGEIAELNTDAEIREAAVWRLTDAGKVARIASSDVNKAVRRAAIAALSDPGLLASIATGVGPILIRKQALQRIREVCGPKGIDHETAEQLLGCLDRSELAPNAIDLMEASGFDWISHCPNDAPSVLCEAFAENDKPQESAVLRRALARLYKNRTDLRAHLLVYLPRSFLEAANHSPAWWSLNPSQPELLMLKSR